MTPEQETARVECFRCNSCGNVTLSPKKVCHRCGSQDIEATQSEGTGQVIDFTTVYYPPDDYKDRAPYTSVLVRLSSGCQLFGIIDGEAKNISPGSQVALLTRDETTGVTVFQLV